jgi:peptidylprolyl isomerase/peptidyl-prolyl cis-trans isomerase D
MSVVKAITKIRPILKNEKKAAMLIDKLKGADLQEIAKSNNTNVRTSNKVTLKTPTLSGVGVEPKIVGAMYNAELNKVYNSIIGDKGVYAFKVTSKELPTALPNYDTNRKRIAQARKGQTFKLFEAIKKSVDIEDNRAVMYSN